MIERRAQAWKDMQRDALVIDGKYKKRKQNKVKIIFFSLK